MLAQHCSISEQEDTIITEKKKTQSASLSLITTGGNSYPYMQMPSHFPLVNAAQCRSPVMRIDALFSSACTAQSFWKASSPTSVALAVMHSP